MSFATEVRLDGRGAVLKADISLDGFSTIAYRYSTHAGIDATNDYDPRIIGVAPLTRGLGQDHFFQGSSAQLVFGNDDELADWLVDQATAADILKARIKLYVGIYDNALGQSAIPAAIQWKQVGTFVFADFPERQVDRITATLQDDTAAFCALPLVTPAIKDWFPATAASTNPIFSVPLPLAFGDDYLPCDLSLVHPSLSILDFIVVCVTTSTAVVTANDVTSIRVKLKDADVIEDLPATYKNKVTGIVGALWTAKKSATITKDGKDFKVLYVEVDLETYTSWWYDITNTTIRRATQDGESGVAEPLFENLRPTYTLDGFWVKGYPLSSRTVTTQAKQHPTDIATDLVAYYSRGTIADVDTTLMAKTKAAYSAAASAAGVIGFSGDEGGVMLRQHLSDLAASFDADIFMTWAGQLGMTSRSIDYASQTATLEEIDETRVADFRDRQPSLGARGSVCNRARILDFRAAPAFASWTDAAPPEALVFDDPTNTQSTWRRLIQRDLTVRWVPSVEQRSDPWATRHLDTTFRPRVSFTTTLEALLFDLGEYFKLNWTRNLGASDPYSATIFQADALTLDFSSGTVTVEALWADDLRTDRPYLLDNETLLTRVSSGGGRTATVVDSSSTVTFNSGSLITDGVVAGDHLILKDATEAATSFKRFKAVKITSITDATRLVVSDALDALDFGAGAGVAVATWEIRRSHVTYPTVVTDAVNYADGGNMYGRVAGGAVAGVYTAAGTGGLTAGHKLLDG